MKKNFPTLRPTYFSHYVVRPAFWNARRHNSLQKACTMGIMGVGQIAAQVGKGLESNE